MALRKAAQHRCIRKVFSPEESEALLHFVLLLYRTHFTPLSVPFFFPGMSPAPLVYLVWKERHWSYRVPSSWTLHLCFDIMAGWRRSHVPQGKQCESSRWSHWLLSLSALCIIMCMQQSTQSNGVQHKLRKWLCIPWELQDSGAEKWRKHIKWNYS